VVQPPAQTTVAPAAVAPLPDVYTPYLDALIDELITLQRATLAAGILTRVARTPVQLAREVNDYLAALDEAGQ